jgi:hypothetical protein
MLLKKYCAPWSWLVGCLVKSRRLRLDRYAIIWRQRKCIQNSDEEASWISATWKTKDKE